MIAQLLREEEKPHHPDRHQRAQPEHSIDQNGENGGGATGRTLARDLNAPHDIPTGRSGNHLTEEESDRGEPKRIAESMGNLEGAEKEMPAKHSRQECDEPAELRENHIGRSLQREQLPDVDLAVPEEPDDQAGGEEEFEPEPESIPRARGLLGRIESARGGGGGVGQDPCSSSHARQSSGRNIRSAPVRATAERYA